MNRSLVRAQSLLMRVLGTRKLQEALDGKSDAIQSDLAGRLEAVRDENTAHRLASEARLDALQRSLSDLRALLDALGSEESARARAIHERGQTRDNDVRAIQASLDRIEKTVDAVSARPVPREDVLSDLNDRASTVADAAKRPAPPDLRARPKPGSRKTLWLRPRRPRRIPRSFAALVPLEWRRTIRPFLVFKSWNRDSVGTEIVMLVVSALRIDPRVEREARALATAGWTVTVIAPDLSHPPASVDPIDWGQNIRFHLLPIAASAYVMSSPWLVSDAMYVAAMGYKPFAYHCHDLTAMLIGLRAARDKGARLLCDHHEWYSENVTWNDETRAWEPHEARKRLLFRWVERHVLRLADRNITVNRSIARRLEAAGCLSPGRVAVLRNIPALKATPTRVYPPLKQQLGLPSDAFVVMYQGGTGPARMLEPVIRALAFAPKVTLVIRGPSLDLFGDGYRSVARAAGVEDRLLLVDPVPSRDVVAAARGADVGLWTLPKLSLNFYLALPNKIFEYLAAGLPLLVADFPEASGIAKGLGVGLAFDPYDPASIAVQMNRFADDPALLADCRAAVPVALETLDADREWDRLREIYAWLAHDGPAVDGGPVVSAAASGAPRP